MAKVRLYGLAPVLPSNNAELLLVLNCPKVPLHNNGGENAIRDYVKKRKISATTRSYADLLRNYPEAFPPQYPQGQRFR